MPENDHDKLNTLFAGAFEKSEQDLRDYVAKLEQLTKDVAKEKEKGIRPS